MAVHAPGNRGPWAPALLALLFAARGECYDWLQFNGGPAHAGNNVLETTLDRTSVAALALKFQVTLPAAADGAPVLLQSVATSSGVHDLLFVTTRAGHVVALDAQTGATIWSRQYAAGACRINNGGSACYTTSSPAADPSRLYVCGYGLDGYVHKYQVGGGVEIATGGWPQLATTKGVARRGLRPGCRDHVLAAVSLRRLADARPPGAAQAGATGEAERGSASVSERRRPELGARDDDSTRRIRAMVPESPLAAHAANENPSTG
jgi:hypothetical protein